VETGALSPFITYQNTGEESSTYSLHLRHFDSVWDASKSIFAVPLKDLRKETEDEEKGILDQIRGRS